MSTAPPAGIPEQSEPWGELEHLSVQRDPDNLRGVVLVTLDLPDRRNSMSEPMTRSWGEVMRALAADRSVRAVVVTGSGRAFCAGGDFSWLGATPDARVPELRERMMEFYRTWLSVRDLRVPTIAAINGAAIGAGLAMALACDIRIAGTNARLAVPFTSLGLHPGMATTWLLRQAAGDTVARDMLFTGRAVTGDEGAVSGLVSRAVPADEVVANALATAGIISTAAPVATELTKTALGPGGPQSFEAALAWDALAQPVTLAMDDLHEGLAAARERRPPRFSGQ
jgi:enoyl-CoA hydratase